MHSEAWDPRWLLLGHQDYFGALGGLGPPLAAFSGHQHRFLQCTQSFCGRPRRFLRWTWTWRLGPLLAAFSRRQHRFLRWSQDRFLRCTRRPTGCSLDAVLQSSFLSHHLFSFLFSDLLSLFVLSVLFFCRFLICSLFCSPVWPVLLPSSDPFTFLSSCLFCGSAVLSVPFCVPFPVLLSLVFPLL